MKKWLRRSVVTFVMLSLMYLSAWMVQAHRTDIQCQQYGYSHWRVDPDFEQFCVYVIGAETHYRTLEYLDPENRAVRF